MRHTTCRWAGCCPTTATARATARRARWRAISTTCASSASTPTSMAWRSASGRNQTSTRKRASSRCSSATSWARYATAACVSSRPTSPGWAQATASASTAWPMWRKSCPSRRTMPVPSSSPATAGQARNAMPASGAATRWAGNGSTYASTSPPTSARVSPANPTWVAIWTASSADGISPSTYATSSGRPSRPWN